MNCVRFSTRAASWSVLLAGLLALVSCVPYQKYNKLRAELDRANRANEDLVRRYHQSMLKNRQEGDNIGSDIAPARYRELEAEVERLRAQLGSGERNFSAADLQDLPKQVVFEGGGLSLGSDLLFPSGVATLKKGHLSVLDSVAGLLKAKYTGEKFIIEGHTDSERLKSTLKLYGDNWELGYRRARAVFEYFRNEHQIPKEQMVVVTYGFMRPIAREDSDEGKSKNRRVVIRRGGVIRGVLTASR